MAKFPLAPGPLHGVRGCAWALAVAGAVRSPAFARPQPSTGSAVPRATRDVHRRVRPRRPVADLAGI